MLSLHSGVVLDVAVLPMLLFNPFTILLALAAVVLVIIAVGRSIKRREEEQELEEKLRQDKDK